MPDSKKEVQPKHTPRPWTIKECNCPDDCGQFFLSISRADGRLDRADAVLIAAAPDMLETLSRLANTSEVLSAALRKKHPKFADGFMEMAGEACEAIAKAEGKS